MSLESPSVACGSTVSTTIGDDEREEESDATNLSRDKMVPQQVQMNPAPTVAFIEHHHSHILYISLYHRDNTFTMAALFFNIKPALFITRTLESFVCVTTNTMSPINCSVKPEELTEQARDGPSG